jgi:general secretion pathway protein G
MGRCIRNKAGFTLIELMVVIIILGLLAAIVMPRIVGETDKARYGAALAQMRILEDALKRYKLDNGLFPTTDQGLDALVRRPTSGILPRGWPEGGYLDKQEIPRDPGGMCMSILRLASIAPITI